MTNDEVAAKFPQPLELGAREPAQLAEQLAILADGVAGRAMVCGDPSRGDIACAAAETLPHAALPS